MKLARVLTCGLFLSVCELSPSTAVAQSQSAAIAGVVKDETGAVLPGVTVEASSPALIENARSVVTDSQGTYKIVELRPGTYTVTFARAGFNTLKWEGLELTSAFTATINAEMRVGLDRETVTVAGEAPTVDLQNVAQKVVTSRQVMDALPTDRNFVSIAAMTPGIQVVGAVQNVGGAIPEAPLMLQMHGSRIGESRLFVDGMSVMSGGGTGGVNFGNYLNNAMAQEIVVNGDSMSAEFEVAGVTSNFITKEGSNTIHGFFSGRYTNSSLQSTNLSADLAAQGLANQIKKIWDANPAVGGPLLKDRLWLFGSIRHWGTYNYVFGLYDDLDPAALFYTPDPGKPAIHPVWHATGDARLTFQATPRNKINGYYGYQYADFGTCANPTRLTAPSGCAHAKNDPQWFAQASWSSPITSRLLIEAGGTTTMQNAIGRRDPGVPANLSSITELSNNFTWRAPTNGFGGTRNKQSNYRAAVSYVTGTHAVKVGLTLLHQWRVTGFDHNNGVNYLFSNGIPNQLTQFAEPTRFHERVNYNLGLYAQDQWTVSRLTLNLGVRADFLNAQVDAQTLPAGPLIGARDFAEIKNVPNWRDVSPRLGAAYDLFGNGKTAIKATLGRYVQGESYSFARAVNPLQSTVSAATRTWEDSTYPAGDPRRGNFVPDCDLTNVAANGECGPADPNTFGQISVTTRYDEVLTEGFGARPYNWGASLTVHHELFPRVTVYAGYFRRWYGNFNGATQNLAVTNADFSPYCITVPLNSRLPGGGGNQLCGFYDVSAAKYGARDNLITYSKKFGKQEDVYDGFDVTFNARLPNQVLVSGGLGLGRERLNNCFLLDDRSLSFPAPGGFPESRPRATPFCDVHPPMQPSLKLQGVYPLPWGIQTAATFQSLPGPQILAQRTTANAQIQPSLGRNLSSCPNAVGACSATVLLDLIPPGTMYGDRIYQVDLRINKAVRVGRTVIRPTVSVYNLLNANPIVRYNNRYNASWPAPTAILTARFVDFGVQVDF